MKKKFSLLKLVLAGFALAAASTLHAQISLVETDAGYVGDAEGVSFTDKSTDFPNDVLWDSDLAVSTNPGANFNTSWWQVLDPGDQAGSNSVFNRAGSQEGNNRGMGILATAVTDASLTQLTFDYDLGVGAATEEWVLSYSFYGFVAGDGVADGSVDSNFNGSFTAGDTLTVLVNNKSLTGPGAGTITESVGDLTGFTKILFTAAADNDTDNSSGGDNYPWVDNVAITAIPEPGTFALFAGALGLAAVMLRRRRA